MGRPRGRIRLRKDYTLDAGTINMIEEMKHSFKNRSQVIDHAVKTLYAWRKKKVDL